MYVHLRVLAQKVDPRKCFPPSSEICILPCLQEVSQFPVHVQAGCSQTAKNSRLPVPGSATAASRTSTTAANLKAAHVSKVTLGFLHLYKLPVHMETDCSMMQNSLNSVARLPGPIQRWSWDTAVFGGFNQ